METMQDMIEHLREVVVNILHTREGAKVTLICLWHGTTKVRCWNRHVHTLLVVYIVRVGTIELAL